MKKCISLLFLIVFFAGFSIAQDAVDIAPTQTGNIVPIQYGDPQYQAPAAILYDNGPLVNAPGGGFGGADASLLQSALSMNTYGFGHQISATNSVADDFTVPSPGWIVDQMVFFAYQTGSTTTSTINDVRVQIWNGDPTAGGTVIWGDMTTNRLASTTFSNIYRAIDTSPLANNRPIMINTTTIGTTLTPGTYWVQWMMGGTLTSGPWAPPITINGQTTTGNGKQNLGGTTWQNALDTGTNTQQGFPFLILGNPVPVELTAFTVLVSAKDVQLNWETATEVNNSGFSIERKTANSEFSEIGFVAGAGTTTEPRSYSFIDQALENGFYTYRLKQIDFDGTFEYSSEIEVEVNVPASFRMDQNYPNPFNPSTKISFSLAIDSKVSLKIFDVLGQEIATLVNQDLSAGVHSIDFNAAGINSGVYFYKIDAAGVNGSEFSDVKKMILTK